MESAQPRIKIVPDISVGGNKIKGGCPIKDPLLTKILPDFRPIFCPIMADFCKIFQRREALSPTPMVPDIENFQKKHSKPCI